MMINTFRGTSTLRAPTNCCGEFDVCYPPADAFKLPTAQELQNSLREPASGGKVYYFEASVTKGFSYFSGTEVMRMGRVDHAHLVPNKARYVKCIYREKKSTSMFQHSKYFFQNCLGLSRVIQDVE